MPGQPVEPVQPVEERLARRLERRAAEGHPVAARTSSLLHRLGRWDRSAYVAVARLSTPALDAPLSRLSHFANHSKPWFLTAAALAVFGGPSGRRAAATGVAAIGAASLIVNQPMKLAGDRARPDRAGHDVPEPRWVPMPTSTSFPSGHSASALAFAVAVGDVLPALRCRCGRPRARWPSPGSTPGCTTRATCSSGPPPAPCSAGWRAGWASGSRAADGILHHGWHDERRRWWGHG